MKAGQYLSLDVKVSLDAKGWETLHGYIIWINSIARIKLMHHSKADIQTGQLYHILENLTCL